MIAMNMHLHIHGNHYNHQVQLWQVANLANVFSKKNRMLLKPHRMAGGFPIRLLG